MVTRIFGEGRFLFVGGDCDALERQFAGRVEATAFFLSVSELMATPAQNGSAGHFDVAIWCVQRPNIDFASAAEHLAKRADELVLISGDGVELAKPRVLYHWRRSVSSTADNIWRKPGSLETGRLAVEAHLGRMGEPGHVSVDWRTHAYWIKRDLPEAKRISIIIPVRDRIDLLSRCIDSLTRTTAYPNYEIVIVDNDSQSAEAPNILPTRSIDCFATQVRSITLRSTTSE